MSHRVPQLQPHHSVSFDSLLAIFHEYFASLDSIEQVDLDLEFVLFGVDKIGNLGLGLMVTLRFELDYNEDFWTFLSVAPSDLFQSVCSGQVKGDPDRLWEVRRLHVRIHRFQ